MSEPLPEDSAIVFTIIKSHSGIRGKYLMLETGFRHDRTIDAIKMLVLRNLVYVDFSNYPDFKECRFYPKV
jgi:hypothetical protein